MINKLYEKIKLYIKENYKFLLGILVIFFLGTFKLPFFIDAPGGIINVNDKIEIENLGTKNNVIVGIVDKKIDINGIDCILNSKLMEELK